MGFEISQIETLETIEVSILHPQLNEPTGIVVTVASYDGERVKVVQRKQADAALRKQRRKLTAAQIEENTFDLATAAVVSWVGLELDGEPLDCTPMNVKNILKKYSWFAEQIDIAASDQALFIKA